MKKRVTEETDRVDPCDGEGRRTVGFGETTLFAPSPLPVSLPRLDFFSSFSSSGGWGKIKLKLTT